MAESKNNEQSWGITDKGIIYHDFLLAVKALSKDDEKKIVFRHEPLCGPESTCVMCKYFDWS
jgi:hypothetical protein